MTDLSTLRNKGYEIGEQVGTGGFGTIYRAVDTRVLNRPVAIKVIQEKYANDPHFIRRFETEAQIVAGLEHPHIVPLYDYWREPESAFIVLRWMPGGTLRDRIASAPLALEEVGIILDQLLSALYFTHSKKIVHRDISPSNVLFDGGGNAMLGDFGISTSIDARESWTGGVMGSINYLAPEQTSHDSLSPSTDLFSLGIVLFEMLAGAHPFDQQLLAQVRRELPPLGEFRSGLPDGLDDIVAQATAKAPEDRFQSARDFREALHRVVPSGGTPVASFGTTKADVPNPYKGIAAFQHADRLQFNGRDGLIQRFVDHLQSDGSQGRLLAIVGASGSGKTSAARAGLIPRLRDGALPGSSTWFFTDMVPSDRPFEELEAAMVRLAASPIPNLSRRLRRDEHGFVTTMGELLRSDTNAEAVVLIDQFEELFSLTSDEDERARFLQCLVAAAKTPESRIRIIITMRADFYDRPHEYLEFGELLRRCTKYVTPMTDAELTDAIIAPAKALGVRYDDGLPNVIVRELGLGPGRLPLLQYALRVLFDERRSDEITHDDYARIGGVTGALAQRAEDVYQSLDEVHRELARQMFVRLVSTTGGELETKRRVPLQELLSLAEQGPSEVLDEFSSRANRLLTLDRDDSTREPVVEVTHESLIWSWPRFRRWARDEQEGLLLQHRLNEMAREWEQSGREPGLLANGLRLSNLRQWEQSTSLALSATERAYLDASSTAEAERERAETFRREREARTADRARSFRRASFVLAVVSAVALVASFIAVRTSRQADADREAAEQAATAVAEDSALFERKVARATILASGGVIVDIDDLAASDEAFVDGEIAAAALRQWEPRQESIGGVAMAYVPRGCFWMGSVYTPAEQPAAKACIDDPFWIDVFEVTNAQFASLGGLAAEPPVLNAPNLPRAMVTALEAQAFCEARDARLPTEVEWEYAARGVDGWLYPWGNEFDNTRVASKQTTEVPMPVGSFPTGVSWVGAHDMSGNLREFTHTKHSNLLDNGERHVFELPYDPDDGRETATADDVNSFYVIRGGSFVGSLSNLRTSARNWGPADAVKDEHGFRCVRSAPGS